MKYTTTRLLPLFSLLFFMLLSFSGFAQCDDDTVPPTAICDAEISVTSIAGTGATIFAESINEGSYDDCSAVDLEVVLASADTGTPPGVSTLDLPDVTGDYAVVLYVIDQAGNFSNCFTVVHLLGPACTEDTEAPIVSCQSVLQVSVNPITNSATLFVETFLVGFSDNCDNDLDFSVDLLENSTGQPQGAGSITFTGEMTTQVEVWAVDDFGNASSCQTEVVVENNFNCSPDETAPTVICEVGLNVQAHPIDGVDIWAQDLNEGSFDLCSGVVLRIEEGTEISETIPTTEMINFPPVAGDYPVVLWAEDESGNTNYCISFVTISGIYYAVEGQIYQDANDNCTLDADETDSGLSGWTIRSTNLETGEIRSTQTIGDGSYSLPAYSDGSGTDNNFEVEVLLPNGLGASCPTSIVINNAAPVTTGINFPIQLVEDCDYLTVDVSAPFLRRCFENNYYVNYTNYSSFAVEDASVTLQLDPFMTILSSSSAYTDLGGGLLEFELGTLSAGVGGQIVVTVLLSCDAELGATHCVEATIIPFTCIPENGFAELVVEGDCDPISDEVNFTITNVGDSPMASPRSHIIIEDVVMYMTGEDPIDLESGEAVDFSFPANGSTWRLAINQDESFPFGGVAAAFVEGCGGFTPGMATQFAITSSKPNVAQDCQENIGSWDPNDKQAFPRGYGDENYLEANTMIDYLIRFQNTGTDTAFNVRIDDQLSEHLDWTSLLPGASSHTYRMELKEDGLLSFHFDNIMLPDSNVNVLGSNGFVKFQIAQIRDNAIGTQIENTANIYFDFNEAVVTNTVRHTIGENFVMVNTQNVLVPGLRLTVAPNPLQTSSTLRLEGMDLKAGHCQVYDVQGALVYEAPFNGQSIELQRDQLGSAGLYFYQVLDGQQTLVQGKILVQ